MDNKKMFFAQNITPSSSGLGYGYLYNSYAYTNANFATSGWHIPTQTELDTLNTYISGDGGALKEVGTTHWNSPNTGATNSTGFTGIGSGWRDHLGTPSQFADINVAKFIATTTAYSTYYYIGELSSGTTSFVFSNLVYLQSGVCVRLIKDSTTLSNGETSTMTDYDGNVYDTICIGTQEWTVQNWKCTKLNDGTPLTKVTSDATWASATTGDLYYCAYNNDDNNV